MIRRAKTRIFHLLHRTGVGKVFPSWCKNLLRRDPGAIFVLSFPKCGRTWLRLMMGKAISLHFGLEGVDLLDLEKMADRHPGIPRIRFVHDDSVYEKTPAELSTSKGKYRKNKVILLVRDPRDVVVSRYFHLVRRGDHNGGTLYHGELSAFIRSERWSLETLLAWYNIWAEEREVPRGFLLVRYEDMHADAAGDLRRVLDFAGLWEISQEVIEQAVEFCRFENMQAMEAEDVLGSWKLRPADASDPESFKVRRGVIGGYMDYLGAEDVDYLDSKIERELSDFFAFYKYRTSKQPPTGECTPSVAQDPTRKDM